MINPTINWHTSNTEGSAYHVKSNTTHAYFEESYPGLSSHTAGVCTSADVSVDAWSATRRLHNITIQYCLHHWFLAGATHNARGDKVQLHEGRQKFVFYYILHLKNKNIHTKYIN